ncbi:MAG: hypothetical protein AAB875_01000 [Patescibacteria group bacterium]
MKTKTKLKTGDIVIILQGAFPHNDYSGMMAKVEYCKTCCKDFRLQMLTCGNNVSLSACNQKQLYLVKD